MGLLKAMGWRLGFIFGLALTARLIGGLFSPAHPTNEVPMTTVGHDSVAPPKFQVNSADTA